MEAGNPTFIIFYTFAQVQIAPITYDKSALITTDPQSISDNFLGCYLTRKLPRFFQAEVKNIQVHLHI